MRMLRLCAVWIVLLCLNACSARSTTVQSSAYDGVPRLHTGVSTNGQACPKIDTTAHFAPHFFAAGLGQSPTWAVFSDQGRVSLADISPSQRIEHGIAIKALWVIERTHTEAVTISGFHLQTGEPLWFLVSGRPAATSALLDPQQPGIPFQREGFAEFPGYVLLSTPGCYQLQASTSTEGASWQKTFLATE